MRLIQKWLNAGVLEKGKRTFAEAGSPQGGTASPLLANLYLHYVFDLWVQAWRRKRAHGDMIVVRYADDIVVGFEFKDEAERFWAELKERMQKFQLELHPEKTRLIEFGRHAAKNRKRAGLGKPETFSFLGFTHLCGKTKRGRFLVLRQTIRKRMQAKLQEVKAELRRRMHDPVPEVGAWLKSVVSGHFRYFGVPGNGHAMNYFRFTVSNLWHRALCRRSQHGRVKWDRMTRLIDAGCLRPISAILIPRAVCASPPEATAVCGKSARTDLCGGYGVSRIPTATPSTRCVAAWLFSRSPRSRWTPQTQQGPAPEKAAWPSLRVAPLALFDVVVPAAPKGLQSSVWPGASRAPAFIRLGFGAGGVNMKNPVGIVLRRNDFHRSSRLDDLV